MYDHEWLDAINGGDKVIQNSGLASQRIATVERTTNTYIIIGKSRYRRKDGEMVGSSDWRSSYIEKPVPEKVAAIRHRSLAQKMRGVDWFNIPMHVLEGVNALVTRG